MQHKQYKIQDLFQFFLAVHFLNRSDSPSSSSKSFQIWYFCSSANFHPLSPKFRLGVQRPTTLTFNKNKWCALWDNLLKDIAATNMKQTNNNLFFIYATKMNLVCTCFNFTFFTYDFQGFVGSFWSSANIIPDWNSVITLEFLESNESLNTEQT